MEAIKSISDIKTIENFQDSNGHKQYLLQTYRELINNLSKIAEEVTEYKKIQKEILKEINKYSEDDTNSDVIVNDNEIVEDYVVEEPVKEEKVKTKKTTKNLDTVVASTEEPVTEIKTKKTTKKSDTVSVPVPVPVPVPV